MTARALIKEHDARRLAKVAKLENVAVKISIGDKEITIFPDFHRPEQNKELDKPEDIIL